ncbi:hypothetical protein L541_2135 [Bordetella hinzii CA90 BAL1384]|nr:hypothetical protein L541_2135 [Bordetella hinzii CA90 BAL1384]KCB29977.1 hypothetical protein L543_1845 [Bordetella hinzii L60]KCB47279.1 hypothetical protein L538_1909 [Bordetella hinzii 4161]
MAMGGWIMAGRPAIPIDENERFLALFVPYVRGPAASGEVRRFLALFRRYARARRLLACRPIVSRPSKD